MDKMKGLVSRLAIFLLISSAFVSECAGAGGDDSGYFLFTPPFGSDRPPQEVTATKRIDSGASNDASPRASLTPAETLWIGSHKIDWSPLPLFQKFIDHHHQKQQKRLDAQARKFDAQDQQLLQKPFYIDGGMFKNNFGPPPHSKPKMFSNPHHDFTNKFTTGGFFAGLEAAFGKKKAPQQKFAEPRSSVQPDFTFPPGVPLDQPYRAPTTPHPFSEFHPSTGGTILVSPPGTILALSTPGPSISPIIDRLRKMTQWSKQSQKEGFIKKEGKPDSTASKRLRLKKRLHTEAKQHKHNIESIILSNDDDDVNDALSAERKDPIIEHTVNSIPDSPIEKSSKEENDKENKQEEDPAVKSQAVLQPPADLVVLHPTNAALLSDPLEVQQSAVKTYQIKRKDKKMRMFKNERQEAVVGRPTMVKFRFGAEDAKINPYL